MGSVGSTDAGYNGVKGPSVERACGIELEEGSKAQTHGYTSLRHFTELSLGLLRKGRQLIAGQGVLRGSASEMSQLIHRISRFGQSVFSQELS